MRRISEAVDAYLDELAGSGQSPHTIRGYRGDLRSFLSFGAGLPEHAEPGAETAGVVSAAAVAGFAGSLSGLAPASRARRMSALRGFLAWAGDEGLLTVPPLPAAPRRLSPVPGPAPAPDHDHDPDPAGSASGRRGPAPERSPRPADVAAVLAVIPISADRDQLLLGLLARLGLRPGEALALRADDVDLDADTVTVTGWAGQRRRVLIDDRILAQRIRNWIQVAGHDAGPLFPSPSGRGTLRYQSVAARFDRYARQAGVALTLTDLRRAHSADLLAGGVPEWVVRQRLGQPAGALPGSGGTAAAADAAVRAWRGQAGAGASQPGGASQRGGASQPGGAQRDAG